MRQNHRAPNRARRLVPAIALTAALVAGGAVTAAPAFAAAGPLSLTVNAPAVVGFAGGPVEFTEHIGNAGDRDTSATLEFEIASDLGTPPNALSLEHFDAARGTWQRVDMPQRGEGGRAVHTGILAELPVPAGRGTDVRLRLGVPMGTPHNGDTNGGTGPKLTFRTGVFGQDSAGTEPPTVIREIKVEGITNEVSGVPATAIRGGAPIEFDEVLKNPTPSAYTNLGNVLFADRNAKVEVRGADGAWSAVPAVTTEGEPNAGFYLDGRNSSAAPNSSQTRRVRVSYPAGVPVGNTSLNPCVFVNEGDMPFRGTTMCSQGATVRIDAPQPKPSSTPEPTHTIDATATATATTAPTAPSGGSDQGGGGPVVQPAGDVTTAPAAPVATTAPAGGSQAADARPVDGHLATTGSDSDRTGLIAGLGALLIGAGVATFAGARRRRTT
ncbi:hypothetical protein ACFRMQ_25220 [Kitasatospora sp. NPDC056783]|uniref:hypothetical protein n=1 Tax=Kitasatospora sp. NPDC056783 TaxID=3345943 RepID=UPI0036CB3724